MLISSGQQRSSFCSAETSRRESNKRIGTETGAAGYGKKKAMIPVPTSTKIDPVYMRLQLSPPKLAIGREQHDWKISNCRHSMFHRGCLLEDNRNPPRLKLFGSPLCHFI